MADPSDMPEVKADGTVESAKPQKKPKKEPKGETHMRKHTSVWYILTIGREEGTKANPQGWRWWRSWQEEDGGCCADWH